MLMRSHRIAALDAARVTGWRDMWDLSFDGNRTERVRDGCSLVDGKVAPGQSRGSRSGL